MVDSKYKEDAIEGENPDWSKIPFPPDPVVRSERLMLRPLHMNDAPQIARCLNDPKILKALSNRVPNPYNLSDAEWFINYTHKSSKKGVHTHFCIIPTWEGATNNGLPVGVIGLDPGPDVFIRTAEIGYWLASSETGKGYMIEAANMVIDWAFELPNGFNGDPLLRIASNIYSGNEASKAVMRKAGFKPEGVLRDAVWKNSEVKDLLVFGLTRTDWKDKKAQRDP